jgi:nucleotide-binding universal stress UspA family protein
MSGAAGRVVLAVSSDTPAEAVDVAFAQAAERGCPLLAVRTWHDPDLPLGGWLRPDRTARWDAVHRTVCNELDCALESARIAHPTVHVTTLVVDDDVVPFLAALSAHAELLVLGRSRRPRHRASPVDTLVRQAACPVLVVPPARQPSNPPRETLAAASGG